MTLQERWRFDNGGNVYIVTLRTLRMMFQFRDVPSHQRAVLDLRVRQALLHSIDRVAMAEALEGNIGAAVDTPYPRGTRAFPRIDEAITKYPFDVGRAQGAASRGRLDSRCRWPRP